MKKILAIGAVSLFVSVSSFAGDYLTNTNQHASFLRMLSRGATTDVDAALTNPAGLSFSRHEGFQIGLSIQSAYQTRNVDASFDTYTGLNGTTPVVAENGVTKTYKGTASAPIIPSLFGAYQKGDWTISGFFAITGGGGKASFDEGLPMFESTAMAAIFEQTALKNLASSGQSPVLNNQYYDINSAMEGRQFIYAFQLGLSYKINDHFSAFLGGRMNYFTGGYKGYLKANLKEALGGTEVLDLALDCDQTGWGLTPVIGVAGEFGNWSFGAKYEFLTNLNIENDTKENTHPDSYLKDYAHGVNTPSDIPAYLSVAVGYKFLPVLRGSVEYHFYDDKGAGMAADKQKALTKGTNEYLAGLEWDATSQLTLSCGGQITDYGLADGYQTDTSFSCDSYSLGVGARLKLNEKMDLDLGYMWTTYSDYKTNRSAYYVTGTMMPGMIESVPVYSQKTYSRTNKVFGISLNYKF